MATCSEEWNV
jgi:hypothetical protein